jgi:hypothetical protein
MTTESRMAPVVGWTTIGEVPLREYEATLCPVPDVLLDTPDTESVAMELALYHRELSPPPVMLSRN